MRGEGDRGDTPQEPREQEKRSSGLRRFFFGE
jgi:hypothetical protein